MKRWLILGGSVIAVLVVILATTLLPHGWKPDGQAPWADVYEKRVTEEHCGVHDVPYLFVKIDHRVSSFYARDISAFVEGGSVQVLSSLPPGAIYTGWRDGDRELWADPWMTGEGQARAPANVYVVSPGHIERWPHGFGCV